MADGSLEAFIENVSGDSHLRVEADPVSYTHLTLPTIA